jgi:hypothetical protein
MIDISGFGAGIYVLALESFPSGFKLSQFADDQDPISSDNIDAVGYEMLYDGSIFFYDKAAPIKISVAVIPGSDDDTNLKILLQSKKGTVSLLPIDDVTSMVITYPNNGFVTLSNGSIISGPLVDSIQSSGRKKSNVYTFLFGSFAGTQSLTQTLATVGQTVLGLL